MNKMLRSCSMGRAASRVISSSSVTSAMLVQVLAHEASAFEGSGSRGVPPRHGTRVSWRGGTPRLPVEGPMRGGWRSRRAMVKDDCIFCHIVRGQMAAPMVLEESLVVAFLDHRPVFPGHVLVVP